MRTCTRRSRRRCFRFDGPRGACCCPRHASCRRARASPQAASSGGAWGAPWRRQDTRASRRRLRTCCRRLRMDVRAAAAAAGRDALPPIQLRQCLERHQQRRAPSTRRSTTGGRVRRRGRTGGFGPGCAEGASPPSVKAGSASCCCTRAPTTTRAHEATAAARTAAQTAANGASDRRDQEATTRPASPHSTAMAAKTARKGDRTIDTAAPRVTPSERMPQAGTLATGPGASGSVLAAASLLTNASWTGSGQGRDRARAKARSGQGQGRVGAEVVKHPSPFRRPSFSPYLIVGRRRQVWELDGHRVRPHLEGRKKGDRRGQVGEPSRGYGRGHGNKKNGDVGRMHAKGRRAAACSIYE